MDNTLPENTPTSPVSSTLNAQPTPVQAKTQPQPMKAVQQPATPTPPPAHKKKMNFKVLGIIAILLIVVLSFFFYRSSQPTKQLDEIAEPTQSPAAESESPKDYLTIGLSPEWTMEKSPKCNIVFPVPPKASEETDKYWQFEEYEASLFMFNTTSKVVYKTQGEADEPTSDSVEVICSPNIKGVNTEQLFNNLGSLLGSQPASENTIRIDSVRDSLLWAHDVKAITLEGGGFSGNQEYYMFATPSNLFLVRKVVVSQDQTMHDVADRIFSNLQFPE